MTSSAKYLDFGPNAGYIAELQKLYEAGSPLIDPSWRQFFGGSDSNGHSQSLSKESLFAQIQVMNLITNFRRLGHLGANINPIKNGMSIPDVPRELILENYNLSPAQLKQQFFCMGLLSDAQATPAKIFEKLHDCYCGSIGFEFEHLTNSEARSWFISVVENEYSKKKWFNKEERINFLQTLTEAEHFDVFLHTRYIGAKRFSIQGAEAYAVFVQSLLESSSRNSVKEIVLAMAHRGRLNTVVTFAGKPHAELMAEFEDISEARKSGGGDVKYHLGSSKLHKFSTGEVRLTLPPNPSHLEFVNPVANGMVRAKQDHYFSADPLSALCLSVHGDAAFAGQGIVSETFNFRAIDGYQTAGTIHLITNNQIGFTTGASEARSTNYSSDLAKGFDVPVLHINADDVDAVAWAADVALKFRNKFKQDIVIDLICTRKFGHNEGDDPSFTQPLLYKELSSRTSPAVAYSARLVSEGVVTQDEADSIKSDCVKSVKSQFAETARAAEFKLDFSIPSVEKTAVSETTLEKVANALLPNDEKFSVHPKLKGILQKRQQALKLEKGIDWGLAEALSFGSLMLEGISIRLSGQDAGRGTFSHRHLELHDYASGKRCYPLNHLVEQSRVKARFQVYNSPLSESAVMAFDFGYSVEHPKALVLWEGQFGDFANGAQVIIDQFISSSEQKWNQRSGLVLLLPHGFEGQGPEHSSARLERFLQLCSNNNMTVAMLSNPAQYFHLLRRQALSKVQRPLVVMSPKSMLRLPEAGSSLSDLVDGEFHKILATPGKKTGEQVVVCSGKVFYPLKKAIGDALPIIRIEQLYPWPESEFKAAIGQAKEVLWVQEEPENMGAGRYVELLIRRMGLNFRYFGRDAAAGVATGSPGWHQDEEKQFLSQIQASLK